MGQNRKRSLSNKKEKGKGKGSRPSNERDVRIQTDDLAPQGQSPAPRSNGSTSTRPSANSEPSFFEHISDSAITGGTFQQTNGHSNSVTIELNVNHYPPTQDSNISQSATISQPSPPLQSLSSQNVPTGLSSSPVDTRQCTSPSSYLPQQKTNYDIYREQLELQRRGIPLWIPESNGCLPTIYQRTGVTIGDVGIVTPSGAFSFVFNICLPRDHPIQPDDLPQDFEPMNLRPRNIRKFIEFKSGSHLASKTVHKVSHDGRSTDLVFETDASEAAILTLPEGSVAHDLENLPQIQAYAAANIESWYRYINGTCGRQAKNGEIRLVIGCDKTTSWGMAVIDNLERPTIYHQLRFRPVESGIPSSTSLSSPIPLHTWDYAGFVDAKVGPYPEEIALLREDDDSTAATTGRYSNQCLFIRTLNLTLRDDIFASINDELALALTEGWSSFTSTSYSSTNSSSSNINEPRCEGANQAPHGTNFGTQRAFNANIGDDRVTITTSPTSENPHPSDALNRRILERAPVCRVAITRDQHWCSVITEDDESMPSNIQIAERVFDSYDIVEENGVAFLEYKKNALSTSASYPVSASDVHRSELNTSHRFDGITRATVPIATPLNAPDLSSQTSLAFPNSTPPPSALPNVSESDLSSMASADSQWDLRQPIARSQETSWLMLQYPSFISPLQDYEDYPHTYPSPPPPPLEPDKDKDRRRSLDDIRISNLKTGDDISMCYTAAYTPNLVSLRVEDSNHDSKSSQRSGIARPLMTIEGSETSNESSDGTTRISSDETNRIFCDGTTRISCDGTTRISSNRTTRISSAQQCHISGNTNRTRTQIFTCKIDDESISLDDGKE
ncbi:hypothetical protein BDN70DRAFT_845601 [Pholiota conissans]|uniref:Uncharacterized protein n=1 Tax=Pholiota conissans TaxID=109636 RepID=A0A9P6CSE3_9AGAR|nr:hypothetical protein BDN70DRAFT_845601 [Pholiota conissans]